MSQYSMHPSVRCFWGVCLLRVMATSVRTSTSSSAATRPVVVGVAVCARHWLTTLTSAPNMELTLISDHKCLSVVSVSAFWIAFSFAFSSIFFFLHPYVHRSSFYWGYFEAHPGRIDQNCGVLCELYYFLFWMYRGGVSWRYAVPLMCVVLWSVLSCTVYHWNMWP